MLRAPFPRSLLPLLLPLLATGGYTSSSKEGAPQAEQRETAVAEHSYPDPATPDSVPMISPEEKYLFFARGADIYWVDSSVLDPFLPDRAQSPEWWHVHPRPVYASLERTGTYQDWFDVYRLTEGTYAIYEPNQRLEAMSYLVLGAERGVLVDTGTGIGDIRAVVEALTDLPVSVVLTHGHHDHVGGSHRFDEVAHFDHAEALAELAGVQETNASLQRFITGESLWKPLPEGFEPATWTLPPVIPTHLLHDGDFIDLGSRQLEVIHTPGHAPGQISLLDRRNRLLFVGDHFSARPIFADYLDLDAFLASNERLAEMAAAYDHVLGGHCDPWIPGDIIPRISDAFRVIFEGGRTFVEDEGNRVYEFDGFEVWIRTKTVQIRLYSRS
ncbi:MBL fold metallo-hydrolase [Gemmatimonadota bacterium]